MCADAGGLSTSQGGDRMVEIDDTAPVPEARRSAASKAPAGMRKDEWVDFASSPRGE
jgi:hypothetical protein